MLGKLDTRLVLELVRSSQWAGEAVTAEGVGAPGGGGGSCETQSVTADEVEAAVRMLENMGDDKIKEEIEVFRPTPALV